MRSRWRLCVTVAITALLAGCGGGDSLGPREEPFPDVAGTYNVEGGFDGLTQAEALFVGTLVLTQASRQSGSLGGTLSFTASIAGDVLTAADVPLESATVTSNAVVSFRLASAAPGVGWTFSGTRTESTIQGRHTLTDGAESFSGDWVATIGGGPTTGSLSITSSTTGAAPDPDGYTLTVDGADRGPIGSSGTVTVSGLIPGSRAVGLTDVASNCVVGGENPRQAVVTAGGTTAVQFAVTCPAAPPTTGTVRVTTTTTGPQQDPDGYVATLDGTTPLSIATAGSVSFTGLTAGSHAVVLSGVADNCTVAGGPSRTVAVTPGATTEVSFEVTCTAPGVTGTVRVTTTTTGSQQDSDGYIATLDGTTPLSITNAGSVSFTGVLSGSHAVVLSGIANNCTVAGGPSRTVVVTPGATTEVSFEVTCVAPTASGLTLVSGNAQSGQVTSQLPAPLVVRATDNAGSPVPGVTVTWTVAGGGSVSLASTQTDVAGHASVTRTLGNAAGQQTTLAAIPGLTGPPVTFTHTAVAGAPALVTVQAGNGQSAPSGSPVPTPPAARVTDAFLNPVGGVSVTFAVGLGGGSVTGATQTTDATGVARVGSWTLGSAGPNSLIATVTGASITGNPVTFTATATATVEYDIQVRFLGSPTAAQRQAFADAEARWEGLITGDLPDVPLTTAAGDCGENSPAINETIDDLVILASVEAIDGPGATLAQAGPCYIRTTGRLTILGLLRFDEADLENIEADGLLADVILHEMGHVLGYGTIWTDLGLLADPVLEGGTDPHFTGSLAIAAFDAAGGTAYTSTKVPVEDVGDAGTADAHWRESVFGNELMTGFVDLGTNLLSRISVASMGDLGYTVNMSGADSYTLTLSLRARGNSRRLYLGNDIFRGPIRSVDARGRVTGMSRR